MSAIVRSNRKTNYGFTIVELLIVIVVIGILASITIVTFSGIQNRARDVQRKQNANDLAKALTMHYIEKGNLINTGGDTGTGDGWVNGPSTIATTQSVMGQLQSAGYLVGANIKDPRCFQYEVTGCTGYIKLTCGSGSTLRAYVLVRLQGVGSVTRPTELDDCVSRDWWDAFGMNHLVVAR